MKCDFSFVYIQHANFCVLKLIPLLPMPHQWPMSQPLTVGWIWTVLTGFVIINVILMLLVTVGGLQASILMIHLTLNKHNTQNKPTQQQMMALFTPCAIKILMRFLLSEEIAPYRWDLVLALMAHLLSH